MENNDLVTVVTQLYHAVSGQKPTAEVNARIRDGVEAALKIKSADSNLFYGLVAIGLVEAEERLGLSEKCRDYTGMLISHFCEKSSYMQTPKK